jgi:hypothetical protein
MFNKQLNRRDWARLCLMIPLLLAGCAAEAPTKWGHNAPGRSHAPRSHLMHLQAVASAATKSEATDHDVLLAQRELLSKTPGSTSRAVTLYGKAAARGNSLAQYNLGYFYESGLGVKSDRDQAMSWYQKAASNHRDPGVQRMSANRLDSLKITTAVESGQEDGP